MSRNCIFTPYFISIRVSAEIMPNVVSDERDLLIKFVRGKAIFGRKFSVNIPQILRT